jgi:hypothetical protein
MSTDAGSPIAPRPAFSVALPRILSIKIRRVDFEAPKLEYFGSSLSRYKQAVEFTVETNGEIPTRAYGPALFVDNIEVHNSERIGKTIWRFLEFEPERLKPGAPIDWGWMKDPEKNRTRTEFRYEIE